MSLSLDRKMEDPLALDVPEEIKIEDKHFTHKNHKEVAELNLDQKPSHESIFCEDFNLQNKSVNITKQSYKSLIYHCPSCDFSSTQLLVIKEHNRIHHIMNSKPNETFIILLKHKGSNIGSVGSISNLIKLEPQLKIAVVKSNPKPQIKFKCALCHINYLDKNQCADHMKTCGFQVTNRPKLQEHIEKLHRHNGFVAQKNIITDNSEDLLSFVKTKSALKENIPVNLVPDERTSLESIESFKYDLRSALALVKLLPHQLMVLTQVGEPPPAEMFSYPRQSSQDCEGKNIQYEKFETMEIDFRDKVDVAQSVEAKDVEMASGRRVGNDMCNQCGFQGVDGSGMTLNSLERHWNKMHRKGEHIF